MCEEEKIIISDITAQVSALARDTILLYLEFLNAAHKLNDIEERLRCARFALSHYLEGKNEKTGNE